MGKTAGIQKSKETAEIKRDMALPPIPQQAPRGDRSRGRDRNRLRMELSTIQGEWIVGLIADAMKGMNIDDPLFHSVYTIRKSLTDQLARARKPV